jgi:hypothetical protein
VIIRGIVTTNITNAAVNVLTIANICINIATNVVQDLAGAPSTLRSH